MTFVLSSIKMSEKTLKFDNIRVNKKEFHKSKQSIDLDSINRDQIVGHSISNQQKFLKCP